MENNLVLKSIKSVIKQNLVFFLSLIFIIIAVVILSLIPPQLLKIIVDKYLVPKNTANILNIALLYLMILIFIGVFDFIKSVLLVIIGQKITKEIRIEMMYKLKRINTLYFSTNDSGVIVSRFTNDVDTISSLFTNGIISMIIDCFKIIGIIISILLFSVNLGIITLILIPIIYFITRWFQKLMLKAQIANRILVAKINNHISESLKNIDMIKIYSKEKYMEDKYKGLLLNNYQTTEKINYFDSVFSPIIQLIKTIIISIVVLLSSKQLNITGITIGMVAASIDLLSNLFAPIENLGMELQSIQSSISGIKRVNEFYNEKEDNIQKLNLNYNQIIQNRHDIVLKFNNVSFSYIKDIPVLQNINITINSLDKVTFTGRTGVGKSTLFNLIMGLYKPTQGSITLNGIDVCTISNTEKRKIFGYVSQNFSFIKGNILDQISLQDKSISEQSVFDVMKLVGLHDYILSFKDGYNTLAENSLFSEGQKQILGIARAIVTNPPILLLDEITANLDSLTENKIISILEEVSNSRTILSISHRLYSIISSKKIVL